MSIKSIEVHIKYVTDDDVEHFYEYRAASPGLNVIIEERRNTRPVNFFGESPTGFEHNGPDVLSLTITKDRFGPVKT